MVKICNGSANGKRRFSVHGFEVLLSCPRQ
jgi:hypothetical protein